MPAKPADDRPQTESSGPSPGDRLLRKTVAIPVAVLVLLGVLGVAGGAGAGYFVGKNRPSPVASTLAAVPPDTSAPPTAPPTVPATSVSQPSPTASAGSAIPMGAACKWAYPGQATGKISGSGYSIVCLGPGGQVLGGFSGSHSLNAWCADPRHTSGVSMPSPELVSDVWVCTGSAGQSAPPPSTTPVQPAPPSTAAASQPAPTPSASSGGGQVSIPIPMGAACKWAYPGQATGKISGSGYSIVCLGPGGQVLGGFSGSHSLNAWCADPRHTSGKHAPNPALIKGVWVCTV